MDPTLPQILAEGHVLAGKYRILRLIGRGGMAEVYSANHEILHQTVALKVLLPSVAAIPGAAARFLNEARSAARIRSEHVAAVMDVGMREDGSAYIVLEYLEGEELQKLAVRRGPLPPAEAVDYLLQSLEALAHAHAIGIVHRDLKPSNIFLARAPGGRTIVKVFDFGISKAARGVEATDESSTQSQMILGTPSYMAPEQARNAKEVDARADIWALGVILYRLLTERFPFPGDSPADVLAAILVQPYRPMREIVPELPAELDAVVAHCLEKDRNARFASVAELARALSPYASVEGRMSIDRVGRALGVSAAAETIAGPRPMPLPPVPTLTPVPTAPGAKSEVRSPSTLMDASMTKRAGASTSRKWAAVGGVALAIAIAAGGGLTALRARRTEVPAPAAAIAREVLEVATAPTTAAPTPAVVPIAHEPASSIDAGVSLAPPGPLAPSARHPSTPPVPPTPAPGAKSTPPAAHVAHSPPRSAAGTAPASAASAAKNNYDVLDQRN